MILGQLRMGARQAKNAPLQRLECFDSTAWNRYYSIDIPYAPLNTRAPAVLIVTNLYFEWSFDVKVSLSGVNLNLMECLLLTFQRFRKFNSSEVNTTFVNTTHQFSRMATAHQKTY